jgi:hypothetical protein
MTSTAHRVAHRGDLSQIVQLRAALGGFQEAGLTANTGRLGCRRDFLETGHCDVSRTLQQPVLPVGDLLRMDFELLRQIR